MKKKILIVEDEEFLLEMYKMKLEKEGFLVATLSDGEGVMEAVLENPPDLILLDIVMPKVDGYQVLKQLRGNPETKGLKVYILSNLGQPEEVNTGLKKGADGYLVKANITPMQLAEYIKNVLEADSK